MEVTSDGTKIILEPDSDFELVDIINTLMEKDPELTIKPTRAPVDPMGSSSSSSDAEYYL